MLKNLEKLLACQKSLEQQHRPRSEMQSMSGYIRQEVAEQRTVYMENAEVAQIVVAIDKRSSK